MKNRLVKAHKTRARILLFSVLFAAALFLFSVPSYACTNPAGVEGEVIYNGPSNIPAYCNGTNWIAMGGQQQSGSTAPYTGYVPNPMVFSGGNYIRGSTTASPSDGRVTFSVWLKRAQVGGIYNYLTDAHGNFNMDFVFFSNNLVNISFFNSSGTVVNYVSSTAVNNSGWHHFLISLDLDDPARRHVYINDVADAGTWNTYTNGADMDWGGTSTIGARQNTSSFDGEIADFWLQPGVYYDLSIEANRRLFISNTKNPVFLGANGAAPTGGSPYIFLSGDTSTWHTNKGTGGGFSRTGTLVSGVIPPFKCFTGVTPPPGSLCGGSPTERMAFLTSTTTTGGMGGVAGADAICQTRAAAGGLTGRYLAWITDGNASNAPATRFEQSSVPYRRVDGTTIANNWADLTDGTIAAALNVTEFGTVAPANYVFTNTTSNGTINHATNHCNNFTTGTGITYGSNAPAVSLGGGVSLSCGTTRYLFCFEQPVLKTTEVVPSGLVGYWRLDETSGTTALDSSGNGLHGAMSNGVTGANSTDGIIDKALNFTKPARITIGNTGLNTNTLSFTMWIKPNVQVGDTDIVGLIFDRDGTGNAEGLALSSVTGSLNYHWNTNFAAGVNAIVPDKEWSFVAMTVAPTQIKLYSLRNGIVKSDTFSGTFAADTIANLIVSFDTQNTRGFSGLMDDIRLYNRTLAESELLEIYQATQSIRYNSNEKTLEYFDGNKFVSMTPKWPEVGSGLIAHYKLNETSGTTAADSATPSQSGTMQNGLTGTAGLTAPTGRGLAFDGIDDYIQIPTTNLIPLQTSTQMSFAAWFKADTVSGIKRIAAIPHDPAAGNEYFSIFINNSQLAVSVRNSPGDSILSTPFTDTAAWHHVVGILNGTSLSIYVDGTLRNSATIALPPPDTVTPMRIGSFSDTYPQYFDGAIDDVRLYNRALSAGDVQNLYKIGSPIGQSTAMPQGCPNIGDVCDDGTIYAGMSPDGPERMYTTPLDAPKMAWNNGNTSGYSATTLYNTVTGAANTDALITIDSDTATGGMQPHIAAQYCATLSAYKNEDWYLPARDETLTLYDNRDAGAFKGTYIMVGAGNSYYLSSNENGAAAAICLRFENGTTANCSKHVAFNIRCVRKGPAPRCTNPYGMEGEIVYNQDHDTVQYCDGARWIGVGKAPDPPPYIPPLPSPPAGATAHWRFDQTSGTIANDSSGNNLHLTMAGSMTAAGATSAGVVSNAFTFNGSTNYLAELTDSSLLRINQNTSFTASAWVNLSNNGQFKNIMRYDDMDGADGDNINPRTYLIWGINNNNGIYFRYGPSGGVNSLHQTAASTVVNGSWQHITVVRAWQMIAAKFI